MNYKPKKTRDQCPPPRFAGKYGGKIDYKNAKPWGSETRVHLRLDISDTPPASLNAADTTGSFAPKHDPQKYTGTQCIGIATLHKSNAVPIFNSQAAIDAATMRRN
jgi:hypothetical protein